MINLLPPTIRVERMFGKRNVSLLGYFLGLAVASLLVFGVMTVSVQFVGSDETSIRAEIDDNQTKIVLLESKTSDLSKVVAKLTTVNKLVDTNVKFSELIPQIGSLLPQGSVINGLSLNGGITDPLTLNVDITTAQLAAVLQSNLVDSDLFEAADISSISPKSSDNQYKFSTAISLSFTGSADAKKKTASAARAASEAAKSSQDSSNGGAN